MFIYKIRNLINNKVYIGKTKNIEIRWKKHIYLAKRKVNRRLYDAMNKYGYNNFLIEIIEECTNELQNEREIYWIKKYNSLNKEFGYNMTEGGEGGNTWIKNPHKILTSQRISLANKGRKRDAEFKEKCRIISLNRPPMSDEIKLKISKTRKERINNGEITFDYEFFMKGKFGELHPFYKKHHNQETKDKLSEFRTNKTYEELYGKQKTSEIKKKKSDNFKGNKNINYVEIDIEELVALVKMGLNCKVIAKHFNVTRQTIINKFKKEFNMTFTEYRKKNQIIFRKKVVI